MTVAFDAFSSSAAGTGNLSWTHTPVGTPRGVIVLVVRTGDDPEGPSVTYGGVAMEQTSNSPVINLVNEFGVVQCFILGSGIPTGAQTVVVNTVGTNATKRAVAITVTAATNTEFVSERSVSSGSLANPSVVLGLLGRTCFVAEGFFSGQNAPADITPLTGWTSMLEHDFGTKTAGWYRYNTIGSADVTTGWTQTADDAVMISVAISEVQAGAALVRVVGEGLDAAEAKARAMALSRIRGESLNLAETSVRAVVLNRIRTEGLDLPESVLRSRILARRSAESLQASEATTRAVGKVRATGENLNFAEALSKVLGKAKSVSESLQAAEALARAMTLVRTRNEALELSEATRRVRQVLRLRSEVLQASEVSAPTVSKVRVLSESLQVSEAVLRIVAAEITRVINESLRYGEATLRVRALVRLRAEALQLSEALVRQRAMVRRLAEVLEVQESISRTKGLVRVIAEAFSLAESTAIRILIDWLYGEMLGFASVQVTSPGTTGGVVVTTVGFGKITVRGSGQ